MVLSFVHLVLNHSSAYTVFCLHGCFSKVSKNRVSRGPPVFSFLLFLLMIIFYDFIFPKSEITNVLLGVGIVLELLKKTLLKTSKIILMYSNSLARHFSSMFHAKCLLPRLDRLLPVRSCLQNFYQCTILFVGFQGFTQNLL